MSRRIIRGPIVLPCALALAVLLMPALAQAHAGSGLVVKRVSIAPSSVPPGGQITVIDLTKNIGTAPAKPSRTAYLLSVDTRASKDDVVLGQRKVPALRPRKGSKGSLTITLEPQTKAGAYHVLACAVYRPKAKAHKWKGSCRAATGLLTIGPIPGPGGSSPGTPIAATCAPGAGTPAEGIDVSEFQGTIDFAEVAKAGVSFVFARADAGLTADPNYATYKANATSAGLLFGAYQFFEPSQDPVAQAQRFLSDAALGPGNLFPALVVETTGGLSPSELEQHVASWLATVQAALGVKPLIYTAKAFWNPSVQPGLAAQGYPLWVANWEVSSPTLPSEWSSWAFWQYKDNGTVSGISGPVDRDRFNGEAPCVIG
jgi:GH25 family lysozyme M1 (1,4-beta-N-acetylmuramidase)